MNPFSFSEHDRLLSLYHYAAETGEYCGQKEVFIPAHTGLPQYCTENAPPPLMEGLLRYLTVSNGKKWTIIGGKGFITSKPATPF